MAECVRAEKPAYRSCVSVAVQRLQRVSLTLHTHAQRHTDTHTQVHTHTHARSHTCMHARTHARTPHTHLHMHTHTPSLSLSSPPCHASSPPRPQTVGTSGADLQDYMYYFTPAPWLSVLLLKLVQMYPAPGEDDALTRARLVESIEAILSRSQVCKCTRR